MLNKLVDPLQKKKRKRKKQKRLFISFSAKECAASFINSLDENKCKRFKRMVDLGINCGESIAKLYNIPVKEFMEEVKTLFDGVGRNEGKYEF